MHDGLRAAPHRASPCYRGYLLLLARINQGRNGGRILAPATFSISAEVSHLRGALTVHPADEANAIGGRFGMELPKFMYAANEVRSGTGTMP